MKPPLTPVIENHHISCEGEHVLQHEAIGSCSPSIKLYLIEWFGYELKHNTWESESNLSHEVLKEYWDFSVCTNERLSHDGVGLERGVRL